MGGGPLLRAQSARWLCFAEDTAVAALRQANVLCREFALGERRLPVGVLGFCWAGTTGVPFVGDSRD